MWLLVNISSWDYKIFSKDYHDTFGYEVLLELQN